MKFQETVWFNEATGRYNVQPPWKSSMQDLPTNFIKISKKWLNSLQNSLNKKDSDLIKYSNQLFEQLNLGFIEKVHNLNHDEGILRYIPHFPAFKADSAMTKMWIVYDASARMSPNESIKSQWLSAYKSKSDGRSSRHPFKIQNPQNSRYRKSLIPTDRTEFPRPGLAQQDSYG